MSSSNIWQVRHTLESGFLSPLLLSPVQIESRLGRQHSKSTDTDGCPQQALQPATVTDACSEPSERALVLCCGLFNTKKTPPTTTADSAHLKRPEASPQTEDGRDDGG